MSIVTSIGHHGFWGYSSTFDFLSVLESFVDDSDEPLSILLVDPGDIRHIISTITRRRRSKNIKCRTRPIHFYLLEYPSVEPLARQILLLEVINDFGWSNFINHIYNTNSDSRILAEIPLRQRATVFLEIFGNIKVQDRTSKYIEQLGNQLRSLVTDGTGRLEAIVDLSLLRFKEKDALESIFRSYARSTSFDIDKLWYHRCQGHYGDRYDSRKVRRADVAC